MAPIVHGLEKQYGDRVDFLYLDIEDPANGPGMARLGFRATPHFFLLAPDGKVRGEWQGVQARSVLSSALEGLLRTQTALRVLPRASSD